MADPLTLESLEDLPIYSAHFMDPVLWEPYVRLVCQRHNLPCGQVQPGFPGTYPTFIVNSVVVKFFGLPFDGATSFRIERALGLALPDLSLPIPSPHILAAQQLSQLTPGWSYLVLEYVPGVSIGQVREQISADDWLMVAQGMGEYMKRLHTLTASPAGVVDGIADPVSDPTKPSWDGYTRFLGKQRAECRHHHQAWNDLPAHLIDQLEDFVLPVEQLVDFSTPPHLIHADLTGDHLLGSLVGDRWQSLAIIDWGDAMTGNILYELVALHLDLFRSDTHLLQACLSTYALPDFYRPDFPRKALSMTLLHQFPMPASVYAPHRDARTLQELAERLFLVRF
jgi:hypothetical protein